MAGASNSNVVELTSAEMKKLPGPAVGTPFDLWDRLWPAFDGGKVLDVANTDVRAIKDMLRQDGSARKVEQVLTLPIRSAAWEIRAAPGGQKEYDYIRSQLDDKMDRVIDQMTTAISFRKAFFELTFSLDGDTVNLASIDYRPPASCQAAWDPKTGAQEGFQQRVVNPGGLLTMQAPAATGALPGYVVIERDRSFVFVHGAYREPIDGLSDLDVALWAYQTSKKIQFLWFSFLEQQATPKILAYGTDQPSADQNAVAISQAVAGAAVGVERPNDPTLKAFEILETSGQGASQFQQALNYLEGKVSASVLAGFTDLSALASHTRSQGSYALSADQSEFFLSARQAVADEMAEAVSRQLIAHLCHLQFGADCKPPTLVIGPLSKHDKERAVNMLNALITAPQFNVPPQLVDILINSTAGYLGLPVDQVAEMVRQHPTVDPQLAKARAALVANGTLNPDGSPIAAGTVAPTVPPDPTALAHGPAGTLKELAALAHAVDLFATRTEAGEDPRVVVGELTGRDHSLHLANDLVARTDAGEDAAHVLGELALTRYVRTEAGVKRYGLPIGSPIGGSGKASAVGKAAVVKAPAGTATAVGKTASPSAMSPLDKLKAQAEKLGPNSKAAHVYEAAKVKANATTKKTPAKKMTLADLGKKLPPKTMPKPAAKTAKPKLAMVTAEHKASSLTGLSRDQLAALTKYTGDDYRGINGGLRKKPPGTTYANTVTNIDTALAAKPLAAPTKVWRTVGGAAFGLSASSDASAALKGKVFTEAGFMSTSVKNQRFPAKPPPVHLTIEVPPGVGAAYLEPITKNETENELLLQRNLRYVITNVRYSSAKGGWTATARVLPGSVAA